MQCVVPGQGNGVSDTPAGSHPSVVKFLALCQCVFLVWTLALRLCNLLTLKAPGA